MDNRSIGIRGEDLAAAYLEQQGYRILARQYRFERAEVDLVCFEPAARPEEGGEIVFVEVKTRRGLGFGQPEEAVTPEKQRHLIRAAQAYLYEHHLQRARCRFDVIAIVLHKDRSPEITHFKDAFWAG
jgi:putative endonuclease